VNTSTLDFSNPEQLFRTCFAALYPPDALANLEQARTTDANPGNNPSFPQKLAETADSFVKLADEALGTTLDLDFQPDSIRRLSRALTKEVRDRLALHTTTDGPSLLVLVIIHASAYIGECMRRQFQAQWLIRNPLWESRVRLESRAGIAELAPFSWLLRSFSDPEIGKDTLAERWRLHVDVPCAAMEELPVVIKGERKLPRLKSPKYDTLYKYFRAHLPEFKDLGQDFPSPERFAEFSFGWLDFLLVGNGRMVLLAGPAKQGGVHLFWIDSTGFQKSAYYPADSFPDPIVKHVDDKIQILFHLQNKQVMQEILWWGPLRW
jgi:hypothetical protein